MTAAEIRAARAVIERALDYTAGPDSRWPWLPRISCWLDALVLLEDHERFAAMLTRAGVPAA